MPLFLRRINNVLRYFRLGPGAPPPSEGHAQFIEFGTGGTPNTNEINFGFQNAFNRESGTFTITAWLKLDVAPPLATFEGDAFALNSNLFGPTVVLLAVTNGSIATNVTYFGLLTDTATNQYIVSTEVTADTDPHMLAISFDTINFSLYLDGNLVDSVPGVDIVTDFFGMQGEINNALSSPTAGSWGLDDVRIYDDALNGSDITDLFNGTPISAAPVISFGLDTDSESFGPDYIGTLGGDSSYVAGIPGLTTQALRVQSQSTSYSAFQALSAMQFDLVPNTTVSFWVKVDDYGVDGYVLPAYCAATDGSSASLQIELDAGGLVNAQISTGLGTGQVVSPSGVLTDGVFSHIAFTAGPTNVELFVDGVSYGTSAIPYSANDPVSSHLLINPAFLATDNPCDFTIGLLQVYDVALSPADIADLAAKIPISTNPVQNFSFDGTANNVGPQFISGDDGANVTYTPPNFS